MGLCKVTQQVLAEWNWNPRLLSLRGLFFRKASGPSFLLLFGLYKWVGAAHPGPCWIIWKWGWQGEKKRTGWAAPG